MMDATFMAEIFQHQLKQKLLMIYPTLLGINLRTFARPYRRVTEQEDLLLQDIRKIIANGNKWDQGAADNFLRSDHYVRGAPGQLAEENHIHGTTVTGTMQKHHGCHAGISGTTGVGTILARKLLRLLTLSEF